MRILKRSWKVTRDNDKSLQRLNYIISSQSLQLNIKSAEISGHINTINKLNSEISALQLEIINLHKAEKINLDEINEFHEELERIMAQSEKTHETTEETIQEVPNSEIRKLLDDIQLRDDEIRRLGKLISELEAQHKDESIANHSEIERLNEVIKTQTVMIGEKESERWHLVEVIEGMKNAELEKLKNEPLLLKSDNQDIKSDDLLSLSQETPILNELSEQNREENKDLQDESNSQSQAELNLKAIIEKKNEEIISLNQIIQNLNDELLQAKQDCESYEIKDLKLEDALYKLESEEAEVKRIKHELDVKITEGDSSHSLIQRKNEEIEDLHLKLKNLTNVHKLFDEAKQELETAEKSVKSLESEISALKRSEKEKTLEISILTQNAEDLPNLKRLTRDLENENEILKEKISFIEKSHFESSEFLAQIDSLNNRILDLTEKNDEKETIIQDLNQEKDNLREILKNIKLRNVWISRLTIARLALRHRFSL